MVKTQFNKEGLKLYNADCFDLFKQIKDNSIDLFVLDLPFQATSCDWDCAIDLDKMWIDVKRIMKEDAVLCFFCTARYGYQLIKSNEKMFSYDLIWSKSRRVGFLDCNRKQLRAHECIYIFKEKKGVYNPQKVEGKPYKIKATNIKDSYYRGGKKDYKTKASENKGDRFPVSIVEPVNMESSILKFNNPYKTIHRTEKPVGLLEYLIKTYSDEKDTVMDFTMGSGSCAIACLNTKRKFVGCEMDEEIFKRGLERLKEIIKDKKKNKKLDK